MQILKNDEHENIVHNRDLKKLEIALKESKYKYGTDSPEYRMDFSRLSQYVKDMYANTER